MNLHKIFLSTINEGVYFFRYFFSFKYFKIYTLMALDRFSCSRFESISVTKLLMLMLFSLAMFSSSA